MLGPPFSSPAISSASLRRNVSSVDRSIINQFLIDGEKELKRYEDEISRLKSAILELEEKQETLKHSMDTYRSLLVPIHEMPPETLTIIFGFCCEVNELDNSSRTVAPALSLSAVCAYWREIVLAIPSLWSSISIEFFCLDEEYVQMGSDFARLFMERSRTSPLTIILSFNFGEDEDEKHHDPTTPILDVLAQHSARWFDVRLHFHQKPVEYPELAPIRGHLPLLQYLDVQVDDRISEDDDEDDEDILWDFFAECPSLHTVSLSVRGRFFDAIILPWEQVTCLKMPKGSSSPDELIRRCSLFPNVERLEVEAASGVLNEYVTFRSPRLRSLSITAHTIGSLFVLPLVKAPQLSSLKISGATDLSLIWKHDTELPLDERFLTLFLHFSRPAITSLQLKWVPIKDTQLLFLLDRIPTLRILHLWECTLGRVLGRPGNHLVTKTLLNRLQVDYHSAESVLLPRLTNLELHVVDDGFAHEALLQMLPSRLRSDSTRASQIETDYLQSFSLVVVGKMPRDPGPEFFNSLQSLSEFGLHVTTLWTCEHK